MSADDRFKYIPQLIRDVCAEHLLPHYQNLRAADIRIKTAVDDVVTIADVATENALRDGLGKLFPDMDFIGEESYVENNRQPIVTGFICDPIDGTIYFKDGVPTFCLMLTYTEQHRPVYSWIYQPCTGDMMIARQNRGVALNTQPIYSVRDRTLDDQLLVGHFGRFTSDAMQPFLKNIQRNGVLLGEHICASMDFLRFAAGEIDNILYKNSYPWDMAAGALLIKELGGHAALLYSEQDLNQDLFSHIQQPVLFTRYKADWSAFKDRILSAG